MDQNVGIKNAHI